MNTNNIIKISKSYIRYFFTRFIQWIWKQKPYPQADKIRHILIVEPDPIGDMVLATPFLRELRRNYTDAKITLVTRPSTYNMMELCPYVDRILVFKKMDGSVGYFLNFFLARKFVKKQLSNEVFDLAITPRWEHDSCCHAGIIMYLTNARKRISYSEHSYPEKEWLDKGYDYFFTDFTPSNCKIEHEVDRKLDILKNMGCSIRHDLLELWTNDMDCKYAEQLLQNSMQKRIVIVPSASMPLREWDIENFIQLIRKINQNHDFDFIILGDKQNTECYGNILANNFSNVYNLVGQSTLRQTVEIMKKCKLYIGGDTGPMHIAAAIGLPGVVISCHPAHGDADGINSPLRFGPWKSRMKVIQPTGFPGCEHKCVKNYAHCINQITVDQVYDEIRKLIFLE